MVLIRSIDWVRELDPAQFWAVRDFRYLQRPQVTKINSSMMWFNVTDYSHVWREFSQGNIAQISKRYPGDQDYLDQAIDRKQQKFFEDRYFQSYRWQSLDGGFDFQKRRYLSPGTGIAVSGDTAAIVFHGSPNPHELQDPMVVEHWK
jgi:hypothetical protein